ncbi:unnamed protein product [Caenorhabditis nigoni]
MCKMEKEDNTGNEPASEIMLQTIQALEKEADELKKDHQQEFDQLSDRLQSIEASVSEILKLDAFAQKSKYDTKKEPESINQKSFQLKHVFNVNRFTEGTHNFSEWEDHFHVKWRMRVERHNNRFEFYVYCDPIAPADKWSIRTRTEGTIGGENIVSRKWENFYEQRVGYGIDFLGWDEMKRWFLVDGNLTVEATVTIIETTGLGKKKIREFDESQKDVSDIILVVRDTKFYVLKKYLASQSSVFKALLLGNLTEHSEVKLDDSDPDDFHYFLEALYGEPAIDDSNVEGVALLADKYDAPTAARRCQEFLLEKSKKTAEKKREIPTLENLWKTGNTTNVRNHADRKPELTLPDLLVWVFIIMLVIWWKFG